MLIISGGGGGSYGINRWVCFHHIAPPQSLLYDNILKIEQKVVKYTIKP